MKSFPEEMFKEELITHGAGPCETYAYQARIEMHLEHGVLVLLPHNRWDWYPKEEQCP